jgi:hypothetical protein
MSRPLAPVCAGLADRRSDDNKIALSVAFPVGRLTPRGVRRRFIDSLRIAIARARFDREIDPAVAEELWRALPSIRGQRT